MPASSLHLLSLPDDLLARCFAELSFVERQQALPLTCRRFCRLVNSPQLLRTVQLDSTESDFSARHGPTRDPSFLLRAQSFASWAMLHASGAVQRLALRIGSPSSMTSSDPDSIWSELLGVLAACGAAGSLQDVQLYVQFCTAALPAWLPVALRSVRLLHLQVEDGALLAEVPLTAMTALTDLRLEATIGVCNLGLHFPPAATLPPVLQRLHIAGTCWKALSPKDLPAQIAGLPALKHLTLDTCNFSQEGFGALAELGPSLQELAIYSCCWPPAPDTLSSLSRLTFLDVDSFLAVRNEPDDDILEMLEGTLAALPQLQALRVSASANAFYLTAAEFPSSATALQHLQHLVWDLPVLLASLPPR